MSGGAPSSSSAGGRLGWVEVGRGIAALLVMVSHVNAVHPVPLDAARLAWLGNYGVGFFFVLSGYIMCHVHGRDIGRPGTMLPFAWRRAIRIWPTYLLVLAVMLALNQAQRAPWHIAISPAFVLRQAALLPGQELLVGPAWSLRDELFFYATFALLLLDRRLGVAAFAVWGALLAWRFLVAGMMTTAVNAAPALYLHHVNLAFFAGLALGVAERRGRLVPFAVASLGAGLALLAAERSGRLGHDPRLFATALWPLFAGLLGGLILLSHRRAAPRPLIWLGAISYVLYLLHLGVFIVLRRVDHLSGGALDAVWPLRAALQCAVALAIAGLVHRRFEQPMLRRFGRWPFAAQPLPVAAREVQ